MNSYLFLIPLFLFQLQCSRKNLKQHAGLALVFFGNEVSISVYFACHMFVWHDLLSAIILYTGEVINYLKSCAISLSCSFLKRICMYNLLLSILLFFFQTKVSSLLLTSEG